MKCNYSGAIERARQKAHDEWRAQREAKLNAMTEEERQVYLAEEKQRTKEALSLLGSVNAVLSDTPYSRL